LFSISVFFHSHVCLFYIICHLVVEAILGIVLEGLKESSSPDLGDLIRRCITEPSLRYLRGSKA